MKTYHIELSTRVSRKLDGRLWDIVPEDLRGIIAQHFPARMAKQIGAEMSRGEAENLLRFGCSALETAFTELQVSGNGVVDFKIIPESVAG